MVAMSEREEYEREIGRRNFTRAAMLAADGSLGGDLERDAQRLAFKQTLGEWFNFRGATAQALELGFSAEEVREMCEEIIREFEERQEREGREILVFDIEKMDHAAVLGLVRQFRDRYK